MGSAASAQTVPSEPPALTTLEELRCQWPVGSKCVVQGLQSTAGKHLNGRSAEVQGLDEKSGRLILRFDAEHDMSNWKKIKPDNVRPVISASRPTDEGCSMERSELAEEIRSMIREAVGCPRAVSTGTLCELQARVSAAKEQLSAREFQDLKDFAEQARSHASMWLFYHELRTKPDLRLEGPHGISSDSESTEKKLSEDISKTVKRAYWDAARAELAKPVPDFSFLLARVEELVETMAGFLPEARRSTFRNNAVDMTMLGSQVEHRAFDWPSLLELVRRLANLLMELESPFQSARTLEWLNEFCSKEPLDDSDFKEKIILCLQHLFEKCDILRVEVNNFRLDVLRATELKGQERKSFAQVVDAGSLGLEVTKQWLAVSDHGGGNVEVAVVHGVARLLSERSALAPQTCPEPMRCDVQHLRDFQSGLQCVALLGLVAIVATPFFPAGLGPNDADPLFLSVAEEASKSQPQMSNICESISKNIDDLRYSKSETQIESQRLEDAMGTLKKCLGEDVPAFRLLHDRALRAFVGALGPPKRDVARNALGESPWSLRYAAEHLNALLTNVWKFLGEHLSVYKPIYSDLMPSAGA